MSPTLVFDIETIPDVAGLRLLHRLPDTIADEAVAEMAFQQRRAATGSDFLPLHLHRVVAISCVLRDGDTFRVWSLGDPAETEGTLIQRFFEGIERYTPQLVSWNGSGFDLPVLNHRGLIHGVHAARYWDWGDDDRDFRFNNYLSRYHTRHLDLMDVLAMYTGRGNAPLDQVAQLCGFPGKLGMDGSAVWAAWRNGERAAIRNYCETDVVNTYLVYTRFLQFRGVLSPEAYASEIETVRHRLAALHAPHWKEFLTAWPGGR
jgi:predicted PolB exonuclease-like 3'-5' exonuclease